SVTPGSVAVDGGGLWLKAEARLSDGRVQFFYSTASAAVDPADVPWVQLGIDRSLSGWTGTHVGSARLQVGATDTTAGTSAELTAGLFGRAQVYNGLESSGSATLVCD